MAKDTPYLCADDTALVTSCSLSEWQIAKVLRPAVRSVVSLSPGGRNDFIAPFLLKSLLNAVTMFMWKSPRVGEHIGQCSGNSPADGYTLWASTRILSVQPVVKAKVADDPFSRTSRR